MNPAYISALAALAGAVIGGLTSFGTAWITQTVQARNGRLAAERTRRHDLYGTFMDELALLYSHAFAGAEMDYGKLVKAFALRGRIKLLASDAVKQSANRAMEVLVDLYMGPARTAHEMRVMMSTRGQDAIGDFAEVCRGELNELGLV